MYRGVLTPRYSAIPNRRTTENAAGGFSSPAGSASSCTDSGTASPLSPSNVGITPGASIGVTASRRPRPNTRG